MLEWTRFAEVSEALALQGFNCIPLPPRAKGAHGSGITFKHLNKRHSRRVNEDDLRGWVRKFRRKKFDGHVNGYLLTGSGQHFCFAVVDIDDPDFLEVALETFGETPLYTSRDGVPKHLYYRTPDSRPAHLMGAWGKRTVDIISSTGVVAPGSIHEDGHEYRLSIPLAEWSLSWTKRNVPLLDLGAVEVLRGEKRQATRLEFSKRVVEGSASGFIHVPDPMDFGDSVWCGHVLPSTTIQTLEGPKALHALRDGEKVFATYRDDSSPSAHVRDYNGRRYFWDMSPAPKRYWTMIEPLDGEQDPELSSGTSYIPTLVRDLETRLGIEVETLDDDGYLSDQLAPLPEDSTTFLIAPHGSGKTVFARRECDSAPTVVSVCNTQALTIANASVLGLRAVYDGVDETPRGAVCIPSLPRYDRPPAFFHVDEADAVHGFLHSGKVDEPLDCWRSLAHFSALSSRCLIASADLSFEDIALFTHAIRERNAARRIRAVIRVPTKTRCKITIKPSGVAKGLIHRHVRDGGKKTFIGITTRKLAGSIAQGYKASGNSPVIDLDEVATITNAIDSPQPYALKEVAEEIEDPTQVDAPFFVSGENNRHHLAVRWLSDTKKLVQAHDLIVTSPAVQSGVSLDEPVSKCFLLHENREVPAKAVLQIARRVRNPEDTEIVIGMPQWKSQPHRTDRPHLEDIAKKRAATTLKAIVATFPEFEEDHETPTDSEFAWSWRITMRNSIRSYADPVGELTRAAKRHGFDVEIDFDADPDEIARSAFGRICKSAGKARTRINAKQVSEAPAIEEAEKDRLARAPELEDGERQKLDKASISDFYCEPVTPKLVVLDNQGRYRAKVRAYVHARIVETHPEALVYRDHKAAKGRQETEMAHTFMRAYLLSGLWRAVTGRTFDGEGIDLRVQEVRDLVSAWWKENHAAAQTFFPRLSGPSPGYEVRWFCHRFRALGAEVKTHGKNSNRSKTINFRQVDSLAGAYAERLFESLEEIENEKWKKEIKTITGTK